MEGHGTIPAMAGEAGKELANLSVQEPEVKKEPNA